MDSDESMGDQKKDHSCSVNFGCTKESLLTQEGVHPNIEPFEHFCAMNPSLIENVAQRKKLRFHKEARESC